MIFLLFLLGIFIGSFLNVVIDRLPREENFLVGHSHCDFCSHTLFWYDLLPLISFLFLWGNCRYCHKFIGWKYPLIEITTGIIFAITYLLFSFQTLFLIFMLLVLSCLVVIFYTDLFSGIIPDEINVALAILAISRIFIFHTNVISILIASVISGMLFLLLFIFTRGKGMGFGDVKYSFVMGLLIGFPQIILSLYIAFLTGAAVALILVIVKKKVMKSTIAFGPFLILGTLIVLFWGTQLWMVFQKILGI